MAPEVRWNQGFQVHQFHKRMDLLLVSMKVFQEAASYIYSLNTFFGSERHQFTRMIQRLAPARRQYLRHIALVYDSYYDWRELRSAFDVVGSLAQLQKFTLCIEKSSFKREEGRDWQDPRDDIHEFNVPGLDILRAMRHRTEIVFEGDCPQLAAYFKAEPIVQPGRDDSESTIVEEEISTVSNLGSKGNATTADGAELPWGIL